MKLGISGPVTLPMLAKYVERGAELPEGYRHTALATVVEALLARGHQVSLFTLAPEVSEPCTFRGPQLTIHVGRYRARHRARDFFALERQDLLRAGSRAGDRAGGSAAANQLCPAGESEPVRIQARLVGTWNRISAQLEHTLGPCVEVAAVLVG